MCLINNMKIEKIILIVICIILSILVIRYCFNTYENFQNSDIEYGIIHMTTADMSSIKNPNVNQNNSHNVWNNQLLQLRETSTDTLLLMSTPPSNFVIESGQTTITFRDDMEVNNSKLNSLLRDKKMIGSFIFTDSYNLNDITSTKTIKLLRHNQNDTNSSFGSIANSSNNNFSSNNFELVGSIGSENVVNTGPIYGMNIGFNTSGSTNLINLNKAREKLPQLNTILSNDNLTNVTLTGQIERYLKNKIFRNTNNIVNAMTNLDIINIIKNLTPNTISTTRIMFSPLLTGNFYNTCNSSSTSISDKLICFGQQIHQKLIQYITDNGSYTNISINFTGINQILNNFNTNISTLKYFNEETNNIIFSNIYSGINTVIASSNYPVTFTNSIHDISNVTSSSLTIKIPLGYKVRLQKYANDSSKATIEFSFPFTYFTQINNLYKADTPNSQSLFNTAQTSYNSFINQIVEPDRDDDNEIPLNYYNTGGLRGQLSYSNGLYYMEISNITQGSTPLFKKVTIHLLTDTINNIKSIDTSLSFAPSNTTFTNDTTNRTSLGFYGLKSNIINFYKYRNNLIQNFTKLKIDFINTSEIFNVNSVSGTYNSKDNQFKLFRKYITDANVPKINFYKLKKNKVDKNHVVLGDIAILHSNFNNNQAFFNTYTTIPKHCYKEIRDWESSDKVYEQQSPYLALYKNEYLNTFIVMKENKLPDGKVGTITPCPDHSYRIDNLIKDNNEALLRCKKYNKMKDKNPIFNTEDDDLIDEKLEKKVYDQEKRITMLKEYASRLKQENSKGKIINQEYNRSRLTEYLDKQKSSINNAVDNLIDGNNKVDININYRVRVLDDLITHIIEVENSVIPFETKKKLVRKISEIKNTSLHGDEADKQIDEILSECPTFNMEGYFRRDPPCLGCTIPKDQP